MRLFPILTAIIVVATLFMVIFQRDALKTFAGGDTTPVEETQVGATQGDSDVAETTDDTDKGVSVVAIKSIAKNIETAVLLRGRTEASRRVVMRAETSGSVISARIEKGSAITKGDVLCKIDPAARQASLLQAQAGLSEAEINLNAASKLSKGGFASDTRVANATSMVEAARAGVDAASREIERLEISAPFTGLLEGDTAELGSLMQPGAECATLIQLDPIRLIGFVPELSVDNVTLGVPAKARLGSGKEITGIVTYVADSSDPTTRTFRVEIEAPNADRSIREGLTTEIAIASDGRKAHLVPQSALTLNDTGALGLRIAKDGIAGFAPVEMIRDTVDGAWVTGLNDEETVIVVGHHYVTDGVKVDVTIRAADEGSNQ